MAALLLCSFTMRAVSLRARSVASLIFVLLAAANAGPYAAGSRGPRTDRPGHSKLDRYLQQVDRLASADAPVRVIVTARKGATDTVKSVVWSAGAVLREHKSIGRG